MIQSTSDRQYILGLDVSTSTIGFCVIDLTDSRIVEIGAHVFKSSKSFWEKADDFKAKLLSIKEKYGCHVAWRFAIEEPLMGFKSGFSSAQTITTLMRFNGIISYISRDIFGSVPEYISASHARKTCGIKVQKTAKAGMNGKEQVFVHMKNFDLKDVEWPKTKTGKEVDWAKDATDAYCIAKSYSLSLK